MRRIFVVAIFLLLFSCLTYANDPGKWGAYKRALQELEYDIVPNSDNTVDIGTSSNRIQDIYAVTVHSDSIITDAITIKETVAFYVSTTGSDSNDGSATAPFATIQKALTECGKYRSNNTMTITIADGTYTENLVTPTTGDGDIKLLGDISNPANCTIAASVTSSPVLTHSNSPIRLIIDGIKFQGATTSTGIWVGNSVCTLYRFQVYNCMRGITADILAFVQLVGAYTTSTINCNSLVGSTALYAARKSIVSINQNVTYSNCVLGIYAFDQAQINHSSGRVATINTIAAGTTRYAYYLATGAFGNITGGITINGQGTGAATKSSGIVVSAAKLDIYGSAVVSISNCDYAITTYPQSYIVTGSGTYTYNACVKNCYFSHDSVAYSPDQFDTTIEWYGDFNDVPDTYYYGFDSRYTGKEGTPIASANDISLGAGSVFDITGTTQINTIATTGRTSGSCVTLKFEGNVTVKHNTAGTGALLYLSGSADFSATANDNITLFYDDGVWYEKSRTVI